MQEIEEVLDRQLEPVVIHADHPARGVRSKLSIGQLLLLNAIVCGLEFCACAAFSYIPPMLLKAGLTEGQMSYILGAGPFLGLLLVPVIGQASDKCRSPFGRRRPFIFGLSLVLLVSLLIIPYGEYFGVYAFGPGTLGKHIGVVLLIIGSVLLDFASQACLTPCEALLSDACKNTNQQDQCFTVYSFMVSLGGCLGYLCTSLDWHHYTVGSYFGGQERTVFSIIIIFFVFSMFSTLFTAHEIPLTSRDIEATDGSAEVMEPVLPPVHGHDAGYESESNQSTDDFIHKQNGNALANKSGDLGGDNDCPGILSLFMWRQWNVPLTHLTLTSFTGFLHYLGLKVFSYLPSNIRSLCTVPFCLKRLALANFCSWTAIMGFNLFFTDYVGQAVYGGNPNAPDNSHLGDLYDEGVRMGSWGLLLHCVTAALYAPCIERIVARLGTIRTYTLGMASFTLAMTIMIFSHHVVVVSLMAAATGFAMATVTIIPFSLVSTYHENKEVFFYDVRSPGGGSLQNRGIGSDMGLLDTAYFSSQVVLGVFVGNLVESTGNVIAYIVIAASMGALSCLMIQRLVTDKKQMISLINSGKLKPLSVVETL